MRLSYVSASFSILIPDSPQNDFQASRKDLSLSAVGWFQILSQAFFFGLIILLWSHQHSRSSGTTLSKSYLQTNIPFAQLFIAMSAHRAALEIDSTIKSFFQISNYNSVFVLLSQNKVFDNDTDNVCPPVVNSLMSVMTIISSYRPYLTI